MPKNSEEVSLKKFCAETETDWKQFFLNPPVREFANNNIILH